MSVFWWDVSTYSNYSGENCRQVPLLKIHIDQELLWPIEFLLMRSWFADTAWFIKVMLAVIDKESTIVCKVINIIKDLKVTPDNSHLITHTQKVIWLTCKKLFPEIDKAPLDIQAFIKSNEHLFKEADCIKMLKWIIPQQPKNLWSFSVHSRVNKIIKN